MKDLFPVVILAGGLGTRLKPLTEKIPKVLIPINGEPFIAHQLKLLARAGISQVVICIGYLGDMIENFVGDGARFGLKAHYAREHNNLLGTGGAIKNALPLLGEVFFVLYGDAYLNCDYNAVQTSFIQQNKKALMTIFQNNGQWDKSNIEYNGSEILAYDKKKCTSKMNYIDYGLGIFNRDAFSLIPENTNYDIADLYQKLLVEKQLAAYEITERFYEVGSLQGVTDFEKYIGELNAIY